MSTLSQVSLEKSTHGLPAGQYAKYTVADNGPGMSEKILTRIFDPYFTTKKVGEGSGMGLSIAHGIVGDHKGAIVASSVLGQGSELQIYLPVIDAPTATIQNDLI
jgi:two-component system, cell cycle sensor histidine kinase and response regulator CckA